MKLTREKDNRRLTSAAYESQLKEKDNKIQKLETKIIKLEVNSESRFSEYKSEMSS